MHTKSENGGRMSLAILLSALLAGCASHDAGSHPMLPRTAAKTAANNDKKPAFQTAFYVGSHGWHTSIIVPRSAVPKGAWPAGVVDRTFADRRFIEAGWGDRTFYMAARPNVATAFDAVFLPGASVLHIVGLDPPIESAFAWTGLVRMPCSPAELRNVCDAIGATFASDSHHKIQELGPGLYGRVSRFYPADGRYYFANTCNNWTARMMRAGGFAADAGPAGTWSAGAVMAQARRLARARTATFNPRGGTAP
jgi:uncharacterized protein (TIGR02117 family)